MDEIQLLMAVEEILMLRAPEALRQHLRIKAVNNNSVSIEVTVKEFDTALVPEIERLIQRELSALFSKEDPVHVSIITPLPPPKRRYSPKAMITSLMEHNKESDIFRIISRAKSLADIQAMVLEQLPAQYQNTVKVLNWTSGVLKLGVANGSMATRMRYEKKKLEDHFRVVFEKPKLTIEFKVSEAAFERVSYNPPTRSVKPPSDMSIQTLERAAEYIDDKELAKSMQRLAETLKLRANGDSSSKK